ncbi:MAG: hypothetical protein HZA46_17105 [Planctomycetales bacterium]|nr:hypothetical protein [Planctomycetales bacterium]
MLDDKAARRDQAGDFGITKLAQKAPHAAVNRLLPQILAPLKTVADQCAGDSLILRRNVQSDETAFPVTCDLDRQFVAARLEPIQDRTYFLHFEADDVAAQFIRRSPDPFAMRLIGHRDLRIA